MLAPAGLTLDGTTNLQNSTITPHQHNPSDTHTLGLDSQFSPMTLGGNRHHRLAGSARITIAYSPATAPAQHHCTGNHRSRLRRGIHLQLCRAPPGSSLRKIQADVSGQTMTGHGPITNNIATITASTAAAEYQCHLDQQRRPHDVRIERRHTDPGRPGEPKQGILSETNGTLNLGQGGSMTQSGSIVRSGGAVNLKPAPLTSTASAKHLTPLPANWNLSGAAESPTPRSPSPRFSGLCWPPTEN